MKKFLNIGLWSAFVVSIFVLFSFTETNKNQSVCHTFDIAVDWDKGNQFVTQKMIKTLINRMGYTEGETIMDEVDSKAIESKINDMASVEHVSVFKDMNGTLKVTIQQRKPIARIINKNGSSFYIDDKGKPMPIVENYTARVVVINGNLNEKNTFTVADIKANDSLQKLYELDDLYEFVSYYRKDDFFKAQIEQIYREDNGEYILIPKVGNQEIVFGKLTEFERKLDNYKKWFLHGINPENLNLYKTINLKYKGQIVCTKN